MDALLDIGRYFINPVFYIALLAAVLLGYFRVKKERKMFRTRIVWGWREFAGLLKDGLLYAVIFSVLFSVIGLVVPIEWLAALSAAAIVMMVTGVYQLGSFIYLASAAVFIGWLFRANGWSLDIGTFSYSGYAVTWEWLLPVALISGAMVVAEGLLISKHGAEAASPRLETSSRGLAAAAYTSKRLWLLPVLLVVPGDLVASYAPYWPQLPIGQSMFSFILFPMVFGFQSRARKTMPIYLYPPMGGLVWKLGAAIIVLSLGALLWAPLAFAALAAGAVGRLAITVNYELKERQGNNAVAPQSLGVMIIDVLPDSPASKMGLLPGEVIRKVNGLSVSNEMELYEAIQVNAAHCRLEVLDHSREVRLRQHVIFRHDHHRLGLIIVK
ncbi:MAG TPA: PDZ domain-containing protein [Planococcus sp. (in: firmicutes)]|nr:PDZ domain-containing protein [Planococcus sp. (in: firmicutes)]